MPESSSDIVTEYHAHIYYIPETKDIAAEVRVEIEHGFTVKMGRWHDQPVGPHPISMYQVAFGVDEFARLVPWLMLNHRGLSVFIHPNSGDAYADHAHHDMWLGEKLPLNLRVLRQLLADEDGKG